ncbi:MAG: M23 family metallopeptidase [Desulfobacterales bacterium]|nr:MAG: M23 family metallopeptidase [Desulfobacterales bacterium]
MGGKQTNIKPRLIGLLIIILGVPLAWFLLARLEGEKPSIQADLKSPFIGKSQELSISVADRKNGVRKVWVGLVKDGKEIELHAAAFPSKGFFSGGKVNEKSFKLTVEPAKLGLSDGEGILRLVAWDFSWRNWWHGNQAYAEENIVIDTRPPGIEVMSKAHNVNQGGAGLVIYRTSEPCPESGVVVGNNFFPGYTGYFKDKQIRLAFMALGYQQGTGTELYVTATDQAGNRARAGFYYHIRRKVFRKDTIPLSEQFLQSKMPEFELAVDLNPHAPLVDQFLKINRDLRRANYEEFVKRGANTDKQMHWEGAFLRLPNAANRAGFADHRTYQYQGRVIDQQVHLGIDLAALANSEVPVANAGKVALVGNVGIYGNTVLVDHGFGLFSMYSHLSRIDVKEGDILAKGAPLGRTGSTGLAGGDHLHFSILIHNTFVNPIEWWDAAWIKNNVSDKLDEVKSRLQ